MLMLAAFRTTELATAAVPLTTDQADAQDDAIAPSDAMMKNGCDVKAIRAVDADTVGMTADDASVASGMASHADAADDTGFDCEIATP
jgi:hypothetical protein